MKWMKVSMSADEIGWPMQLQESFEAAFPGRKGAKGDSFVQGPPITA
jgi:hypothetical protein